MKFGFPVIPMIEVLLVVFGCLLYRVYDLLRGLKEVVVAVDAIVDDSKVLRVGGVREEWV